jgi:hypothetical protein
MLEGLVLFLGLVAGPVPGTEVGAVVGAAATGPGLRRLRQVIQ